MKEFCLSSKVEEEQGGEMYYEEDVREFIRLLKEEVNKKFGLRGFEGAEFTINRKIDKLAGEGLI